jgi:xylan 1,4-beta-xylosidase
MRKLSLIIPLIICLTATIGSIAAEPNPQSSIPDLKSSFLVHIAIDAASSQGDLKPIWRFFGADEPNYAYMKNGAKLLSELGAMGPKQVYFRTHNLLTSGDGTPALKWGSTGVYSEDANGLPVYNWTIVDRIFDTYLQRGVRPYVEVGFMPKDFSIKPEPYQHHWNPKLGYNEIYTGWAYPPKDYAQWAELVYQWAKHCADKYGRAEVDNWYWEVWNEANIGYWKGTPEEFRKLHDYAIDALRRAIPTAKVGGPDSAGSGGKFTRDFLEHCLRGTNYATGQVGTPIDFISFHAKGAPVNTNGHVRMGIAAQLRTIDDGFKMIASYPELKSKPIIIGESDPEGCAACQGPALAYRNGTMYSSYTTAIFPRKLDLAARHGVNLEGALTWAFEFEDQPYFAGFRSLASNGIDKPVLNVFRMFARMSGQRLSIQSDRAISLDEMMRAGVRAEPDVSAFASRDGKTISILVWHYHDDDIPGPTAEVSLQLTGFPENISTAKLAHFRIDQTHSNAFAEWQRMGSPQSPTPDQYTRLEKSGQLEPLEAARTIKISGAQTTIKIQLPRQAVSLLQLTW